MNNTSTQLISWIERCRSAMRCIAAATTLDELSREVVQAVSAVCDGSAVAIALCGPDEQVTATFPVAEASVNWHDCQSWVEAAAEPVTFRTSPGALRLGLRMDGAWAGVIEVRAGIAANEHLVATLSVLSEAVVVSVRALVAQRELAELVAGRDSVTRQFCHDLRTPLGNLRMGVELLKVQVKGDAAATTLARLARGVDRAATLVEEHSGRAQSENKPG